MKMYISSPPSAIEKKKFCHSGCIITSKEKHKNIVILYTFKNRKKFVLWNKNPLYPPHELSILNGHTDNIQHVIFPYYTSCYNSNSSNTIRSNNRRASFSADAGPGPGHGPHLAARAAEPPHRPLLAGPGGAAARAALPGKEEPVRQAGC